MSYVTLVEQAADPGTPAADKGRIFLEANTRLPFIKNDQGIYVPLGDQRNEAIAAQGAGFAADTWVTNSDLILPFFSMQVKTRFQWRISASKSGAGTAQPVYTIRIGANRSTGDTARLVLIAPAQTAIADIGTLVIDVVVRAVGVATGVLQGTAYWTHRGTAANTTTSGTGFANDSTGHVEATSAAFDNAALGGQYISLSINGGTSASWTLTQVAALAQW